MTICPDSNIFIYALNAHPEFGPDSLRLLKLIENGSVRGVSTELAFLEVLAAKDLSPEDIKNAKRLLAASGVVFSSVSMAALLKAAELRREHGVKAADSIHLAAAILGSADYFITNDTGLSKLTIKGPKVILLKNAKDLFPTT
jgi:predicted nucleic acid-binding protein